MSEVFEESAPEFLSRLAEKLRHVPGTYDIYDDTIDRLQELAAIAAGSPPKQTSDSDPMNAAEQMLWTAVYAKNYHIRDVPGGLVKEWSTKHGWGDAYWEAKGEWEDEQVLIAIEEASAAVVHFRKVQGVADDDFAAEVVGQVKT